MFDVKYPEVKVKLVGEDGNAFSILGRCRKACRDFLSKEEFERIYQEFSEEAKSGDYNHLLCTVMDFFTTDEPDEEDEECPECGCSPCECDDICPDCGGYYDNCTCNGEEDEDDN